MADDSIASKIADRLRDRLSRSEIESVLRDLRQIAEAALETGRSERKAVFLREVIQHQSAFSRLQTEIRTGIVDPNADRRETARLVSALTALVDDVTNVIATAGDKTLPIMTPDEHSDSLGSVFISYRRNDSADAAGRLYDRLLPVYSRERLFKDVDSIPYGVNFANTIELSIRQCNAALIVIGPGWLTQQTPDGRSRLSDPNDLVHREVHQCLEHCPLVIPVLVGNAIAPQQDQLPMTIRPLAALNAIAVRRDPDFHRDVDRLLLRLTGRK